MLDYFVNDHLFSKRLPDALEDNVKFTGRLKENNCIMKNNYMSFQFTLYTKKYIYKDNELT